MLFQFFFSLRTIMPVIAICNMKGFMCLIGFIYLIGYIFVVTINSF